jgi:hypothetical protein
MSYLQFSISLNHPALLTFALSAALLRIYLCQMIVRLFLMANYS